MCVDLIYLIILLKRNNKIIYFIWFNATWFHGDLSIGDVVFCDFLNCVFFIKFLFRIVYLEDLRFLQTFSQGI